MIRKTYLRYPGGKSKAVKQIAPFAPDFAEYRETMVGGGSMFLYFKSLYPSRQFWINDVYTNLYLFWVKCRDENDRLVEALLNIKAATDTATCAQKFTEFKHSISIQDEFTRAVYFYYLNKCSFSGLTESGTCSVQAWVQNFSVESIKSLADLKHILRGVKITNLDYADLLGRGENVFVYLDPPYDIGEQNNIYGRGGEHHRQFDHLRFAESVKGAPNHLMISYNDSPVLRERFQDMRIETLSFRYTMRQTKTESGFVSKVKSELLILND